MRNWPIHSCNVLTVWGLGVLSAISLIRLMMPSRCRFRVSSVMMMLVCSTMDMALMRPSSSAMWALSAANSLEFDIVVILVLIAVLMVPGGPTRPARPKCPENTGQKTGH